MNKEALDKLISTQKTVFIGSIDNAGFPDLKAMLAPRKREGLTAFYFSTNTSSMRVTQYRANNKACLYFYDKHSSHGVMLIGVMEVLEDAAIKKELWKIGDRLYYQKGVTDPDYCVLKFTAHQGCFYSNLNSTDFEV